MLKFIKKIFLLLTIAVVSFVCFGIYCYVKIDFYHATEDVAKIRNNSGYGLLLGTSKYLSSGSLNPYYAARIDAAARLYKSGVVERIILSGDNRDKYYNEPAKMKADLIERGVPETAMSADPMGLRTYDSVKRCKEIFGVNNPIIITQKSHCKRALYIADGLGMKAEGFAARTPVEMKFWAYNESREFLAKMLAFYDINF